MGTLDPTSVTALRSQQLLRIDGARGRRLTVFSGRVWVTQEGDAGDVFLRNGESLRLTRGGRAIVQALSDAKVALVPRSRDALGRQAAPQRSCAGGLRTRAGGGRRVDRLHRLAGPDRGLGGRLEDRQRSAALKEAVMSPSSSPTAAPCTRGTVTTWAI